MNDEKCMMGDCVNGGLNLSACFSYNYILFTILYIMTSRASLRPSSSLKQHQFKKVRLQA